MDGTNGASKTNGVNGSARVNGVSGHDSTSKKKNGPTTLRILIAGAGVGGLSAALFLRREGHLVEVFESSSFATETGAAIHIPPNANGLLRRVGIIPEDHGAVTAKIVTVYGTDGSRVESTDLSGVPDMYPYPWQLLHRVDFHSSLKTLALSPGGKGTPVTIHLRSRVVDINSDEPSLTLADGTVHLGDVIIGADGVHSVIRAKVQPKASVPFTSGSSAYRFLIPIEKIKKDPTTAHFVEREGELFVFEGHNRRIAAYPCRNNTELNFVCMHADNLSQGSSEDWNLSASKESMLKVYEGLSKPIRALLSKVEPNEIKLWKLLDCDPMATWINGKVALLGDAAHPFLPYLGQGGAQAIEDAAAIGALLPLGTEPVDIPERLEVYMQCRKVRAETVQEATRQSAYDYKLDHATEKPPFKAFEFAEYNFGHDSYHYASKMLKRHIFAQLPYRRMPTTFGPPAGPRQNLQGKTYNGTAGSTYVTTNVTFRSPKSYLETLLPSDSYRINCQGGWATASFSHTRLGNLQWLGGRGYSHFGLYIHNVSLPAELDGEFKDQRKPDTGDFLPVVFENMADPIITGREELGFSKVFANIEYELPERDYANATVRAGWGGLDFLTLTLSNVVAQPGDSPAAPELPTYHHKVMPASGPNLGKGKLDSEYEVVAIMPASSASIRLEKKWVAETAKIEFTDLEGEELELAFPTLANVITGLRNMRIGEILSAGVRRSASN